METLELKKENVLKAYENADKKDKALLEALFEKKIFKKNMIDRVTTMDDVFEELEIDKKAFYKALKDANLSDDTIAYEEIKLIADCFNEGWKPNWDNSSENKYYPWFKMDSPGFRFVGFDGWHSLSYVGSRLCFKSGEIATHVGENFTNVYKRLFTYNS